MRQIDIISIVPAAPGWYARYDHEKENLVSFTPIACFALVVEDSHRFVSPIVQQGYEFGTPEEYTDNYSGCFYFPNGAPENQKIKED